VSSQRNYYIVVLIFLTFFVISFLTNIIGPLVPDIIDSFDLSYTLVAILPFAFFIAYGIFSIPSGILVEKYHEKKVMIGAFVVAFFGALLLAVYPNYLTAVISLFMIGSGMAGLQVVINPLLREAGGEEHYAFNATLAQLIFGLASFLSPLVYSNIVLNLQNPSRDLNILLESLEVLVPENLLWISMYWLFAAITVLMILIIFLSRFPRVELTEEEKVGALETHLELLKNPVVVLFFLGIFTYVGTEQGVANWISEFLNTYHGYDPQTVGAQTVSWFWGMMTAGGLLGILLLKLIDSRYVLIGFTIGAVVALTVALFGTGGAARIAFPLVGFTSSVMYPVIFSLALNSVEEHHGSFSGILVSAIIGGAVIPLIIGGLADLAGLRFGLLFLYVTLGYILSVGFWANPLVLNKTFNLGKDEAAE